MAYRDKEQQGASERRDFILTASRLSGFLGTARPSISRAAEAGQQLVFSPIITFAALCM
jgi:hypothetical protein